MDRLLGDRIDACFPDDSHTVLVGDFYVMDAAMTDPDLSRTLRRMAEDIAERAFTGATQDQTIEAIVQFAHAVAAAVRQEQRERDAEIAEESAKWREPIGLRSNGKPYAKSVLVKLTQCRDCRADEGENIARAIRAQATLRSQEIP